MRQTTKAAGLALIAVVALSAMAAPAQANNVTASKYPVILTGIDDNTEHGKLVKLTIGNGARSIECTVDTLEATLTAETTAITTTPTYDECFANTDTKIPATVTMNGCDYTLEATSKTTGQVTIKCPEGKQIEVHLYENATKHAENKPLCTYDIKPQGPLSSIGIDTNNVGTATEDLTLTLKIEKIQTLSTIGSAIVCGIASGTTGNSSLSGSYTATGETDNAAKEHVAVMVK